MLGSISPDANLGFMHKRRAKFPTVEVCASSIWYEQRRNEAVLHESTEVGKFVLNVFFDDIRLDCPENDQHCQHLFSTLQRYSTVKDLLFSLSMPITARPVSGSLFVSSCYTIDRFHKLWCACSDYKKTLTKG